jgi:hypothetical protein
MDAIRSRTRRADARISFDRGNNSGPFLRAIEDDLTWHCSAVRTSGFMTIATRERERERERTREREEKGARRREDTFDYLLPIVCKWSSSRVAPLYSARSLNGAPQRQPGGSMGPLCGTAERRSAVHRAFHRFFLLAVVRNRRMQAFIRLSVPE